MKIKVAEIKGQKGYDLFIVENHRKAPAWYANTIKANCCYCGGSYGVCEEVEVIKPATRNLTTMHTECFLKATKEIKGAIWEF